MRFRALSTPLGPFQEEGDLRFAPLEELANITTASRFTKTSGLGTELAMVPIQPVVLSGHHGHLRSDTNRFNEACSPPVSP